MQAVVFAGGTLSDLKALSPSLEFGDLTITGKLKLNPTDYTVKLKVKNLTITASGKIANEATACTYKTSASIDVTATEKVAINGPIDLHGKWGKATFSGSSCNQCGGENAGNVTITADEVVVDAYIHLWAGNGATTTIAGLKLGCDGGDGGDLLIEAPTVTFQDGADINIRAGSGGPSTGGNSDGDDGKIGTVEVINTYTAYESEPNAFWGPQPGNGVLPMGSAKIIGSASKGDDLAAAGSSSSNKTTIYYDNGEVDFVEDVYMLYYPGGGSGQFHVDLEASNDAADLDMFILNSNGTKILAESNGEGADEFTSFKATVGNVYLLGVSWCCNKPSTNYTVTISPAASW